MEYQKVDLITSMTELIKVLSIRKLQNVLKNQNYIRANLYKTTNKWVKKQSGEKCCMLLKFATCKISQVAKPEKISQVAIPAKFRRLRNFVTCEICRLQTFATLSKFQQAPSLQCFCSKIPLI